MCNLVFILLTLLTLKNVVYLYLKACRDTFCLILRYFICIWPCISKFTNKFLSPLSDLESGRESKPSPYGAWVLSADGEMTLLSGGEVSTPLCPTFEEKTPEYFLGAEEGKTHHHF